MQADYAFWMGFLLFVGVCAAYLTPTIIAVLRQAEDIGLVLLLNFIPIAWPVALYLSFASPRRPGPVGYVDPYKRRNRLASGRH